MLYYVILSTEVVRTRVIRVLTSPSYHGALIHNRSLPLQKVVFVVCPRETNGPTLCKWDDICLPALLETESCVCVVKF